jgi:Family of unknown function (DUF6496)
MAKKVKGNPPYPKGTAKIEKAQNEFKAGTLKSSSGQKVTNPKQAVAIGLSEQRAQEGMSGKKRKRSKTSGA